jgi:transcription-repair coupling factor (superfamily II helicase)
VENSRLPEAGALLPVIASTPAVQDLRRRVEAGEVLSLPEVSEGGQPAISALLAHLFPDRTIVVVTDGLKRQEIVQQDLETWCCDGREAKAESREPEKVSGNRPSTLESRPLFFPAWEVLPHEARLPHADVISERLETLAALTGKKRAVIVTNVIALMQRTFDADDLRQRTRTIKKGEQMEMLDLIEWLESQGYEPEAQVTQKGTHSLRGGIIDLWPLTSPWPVRLEFFGNELESLRYFDPISQISNQEIQEVLVPPGGELGILKQNKSELSCLLDYVPSNSIFVICDPDSIDEHAQRYAEQVPDGDPFFIAWDEFQNEISARNIPQVRVSELQVLPELAEEYSFAPKEEVRFQSLEVFRPIGDRAPEPHIAEAQRKEFFAQLHRWTRQNYNVHVWCNNDGERQRFEEIWWEYGFGNTSSLHMHLGALSRGFLFEPAKVVVVTDAEIFGRYKVQRPRRLKSPHAQTSKSLLDINFSDLQEGDYVVHLQHGIGRYMGLQMVPRAQGQKTSEKITQLNEPGDECLVIEYAPSDSDQPAPKLYVPVNEAHLVSKYVGAGKVRPPLNSLGGTRWAKTKAQAALAVRDVAAEMLQIQAARASQVGYTFPADTGWQHEFENSFIYEETPDQMRAIVATKKDMESAKPMDRLICGDVGYGKTEVAIRAAFKSALSGKQAAVLVPTTVLAQQHYNNFRERMADYPVRVELLSRFRTRRQMQKVIEELAAGSVDIVIGTHRLLQKDILFKDLGLVVIDEEQRFGVLHKEKFKRLRTMVDVLTLSATPIPRTLYLALAGARDMSTIETPPQDRLPVETVVTQYDERVIRDAIQRELNRGGQVFYLHNRVFDIDAVAKKVEMLVPRARIGVGHGQMDPDDLEVVMTKFINGETDVLLSTTIIESGIDIPNANTIIIDRADRFGLSDLYQLRGRVGRYKHQAYAYLLLPRHAGLLSDARKRISAIKQYSTLGSGFKIAMRDLEIRGAGNLLGHQQSGHITAVGFELYCQLLKQSVSSLKGEQVKPRVEVQVRLDFVAMSPEELVREPVKKEPARSKPDFEINIPRDVGTFVYREEKKEPEPKRVQRAGAFLPFKYISEPQQRIDIYRKLAQISDATGLRELKQELRDRFGPLPGEVELLLAVSELKLLAMERDFTVIETQGDKLMLTRNNDYVMVGGKFPRLSKTTASARLGEIKRVMMAA